MKKILVLNYEVGNLSSIINSLNSLEIKHIVSDKKTEIKKSDIMILPGVGSFKKTMEIIKKRIYFTQSKTHLKKVKKLLEFVWVCKF